jgi:membrane protein YdbS with pleckstrin-like domain
MSKRVKKIYYSKPVAWFTLFIVLLSFLVLFISNYYAPEDKKIPPIILAILAIILFSAVIFTFIIAYRGIPFMIIK